MCNIVEIADIVFFSAKMGYSAILLVPLESKIQFEFLYVSNFVHFATTLLSLLASSA